MKKLSVLIPVYNEEDSTKRFNLELFPVLDDLEKKFNIKIEVIIVNDGSVDSTLDRLNEIKDRRLKIVSYIPNRGVGGAVMEGIKHLDSDVAVMLDSDLTFHPRDIEKLLLKFKEGGFDIVSGSPYMKGGKAENVPFYRRVLTEGASCLYKLALLRNLTSITPIFKLYITEDLKGLKLESDGFTICAEIIARFVLKRKNIAEIPVTLTTRLCGKSKIKVFKEIKNHLKLLIKLLKWRFVEPA